MKKHFLSFILLALTLGWSANAMAGGTVYFKNTLGWSNIYVSFFTQDVWNATNKNVENPRDYCGDNGEMTLVAGTTDVYSFNYTTSYVTICFMSKDMHDWGDFSGGSACYRGDFSASKPMFTPETTMSHDSKTKYYNNGSWTTYAPTPPSDPCPNCQTITKP